MPPTRVNVEAKIPERPFEIKSNCPKCGEPFRLKVKPPKSRYEFQCGDSDCPFEGDACIFVVRKRAMTKELSPKPPHPLLYRSFDLRLYDLANREHHFEYDLKTDTQLEMQFEDIVIFFFEEGDEEEAIGFCNTTIRKEEEIRFYKPKKGCAVFLAIGVLLASAGYALASTN